MIDKTILFKLLIGYFTSKDSQQYCCQTILICRVPETLTIYWHTQINQVLTKKFRREITIVSDCLHNDL